MATIKQIDSGTIHRIQSGQVIIDLCSVAKELVENSVDAGASNIEVRFKNQGLDSIEVQDNGSGVAPGNYASLALKHCTSKLSAYDDLSNLQTFGFRGEALSSLSALSHLSVITCQAVDAPKGTKLKFAASGALVDTSVVSAKQGTTVIVENLFHNLPVRRHELERHIKREWARVISLLNQYACILTGVKFTVSQQPTKGKKILLFSSKGNPTTRENIINIFGAKAMTALIPLDLTLVMEPTSSIASRRRTGTSDPYKVIVKGHVSRPAHGDGRHAPDRQMFFVNGRPCGLPQFAKVFNEVYRAFNTYQSPFIFADIRLDTHLYDVNVSPDKRTILLHEQGRMLENLRESLNTLFEAQDYSVPTSQLATQNLASGRPGVQRPSPNRSPSVTVPPTSGIQTNASDDREDDSGNAHSTPVPSGSRLRSAESLTANSIGSWIKSKTSSGPDRASSLPLSATEGDDNSSFPEPEVEPVTDLADRSVPGEPARVSPAPQSPTPISEENPGNSSRVRDFHTRLEMLKRNSHEPGQESKDEDARQSPTSPSSSQGDLPGFRLASSVFASRKRAAPDVATVTIGDQTVTSLIGSSAKRRREDGPPSSAHTVGSGPQRPKRSAAPSFGGRLSQLFSANPPTTSPPLYEGEDDHDPIEDSDISEDDADASARDEEAVDQEDISTDSSPEEPVGEVDMEHPPGPIGVQSLATGPDDTLARDAQPGAGDGDNEEPALRTKAVDTLPERRNPMVKVGGRRKDATLQYQQPVRVNLESLGARVSAWRATLDRLWVDRDSCPSGDSSAVVKDAEEKLTLTISKGDFSKMRIIGQFNLGFILAVRPAGGSDREESPRHDELFIIDQHASDEKYNFERLQASTVVQSQRLVHPKTLDLTALEEEIVLDNLPALETNGFKVTVDVSGEQPVGARCQLLALPLSKETTFTLADLEELISLLEESHATSETTAVPRPSKVRKMFAMRACRSSIMVGSALQQRQMEKLVRHMGELDKPWNCPHGRPTMRHLCSLNAWDRTGWDGDQQPAISGLGRSWGDYLEG